jgi:hypothetical protein
MWRLQDFNARQVRLGPELEPGLPTVTPLDAGDVEVVNALELAELADDPVQLWVCPCGNVGCEPGGWACFRRAGERVLLLPAFSTMLKGDDDFHLTEYRPPAYIAKRGVPYIEMRDYRSLVSLDLGFPPATVIKPLCVAEAIRVMQWEAPMRLLDRFPDAPGCERDVMLAAEGLDLDDALDRVDEFLARHLDDPRPLAPLESSEEVSPLTFYIDMRDPCEWTAFGLCEDGLVVLLDGAILMRATDES